jgi:hypothetical protein
MCSSLCIRSHTIGYWILPPKNNLIVRPMLDLPTTVEQGLFVEQMILTIEVVKRNNNLSSAIGRCGAHRRKLHTIFCSTTTFSMV